MLLTILHRARLHLARWLACEPDPCPWCGSPDHEARDHRPLHDDR